MSFLRFVFAIYTKKKAYKKTLWNLYILSDYHRNILRRRFYTETGINPKKFKGLCYDSAPNMRSEEKDEPRFILKESENVIAMHCTMHSLNLSISLAVRIQLVGNLIELYKSITFFLHFSPKRENFLKYIVDASIKKYRIVIEKR